jgi:hypothetical protein
VHELKSAPSSLAIYEMATSIVLNTARQLRGWRVFDALSGEAGLHRRIYAVLAAVVAVEELVMRGRHIHEQRAEHEHQGDET